MSAAAIDGRGPNRHGPKLAEGKTKTVFAHAADPTLAVIVHKDAITAGDGARRHELPGKGALSGRTTANVFRLLAAAGVPTHFVAAAAADTMLVRRCRMVPIEVVIRRVATARVAGTAIVRGQGLERVIIEHAQHVVQVVTAVT